ncbi:hypothetical protein ACFVBP_28420 [Nocardioides sp. NPDC057764]|uniref:hypothetical protein n=1 Tax=Nocardioides sp. NPDC057764 TaxID=3346243 RepID=UPI00366BC701
MHEITLRFYAEDEQTGEALQAANESGAPITIGLSDGRSARFRATDVHVSPAAPLADVVGIKANRHRGHIALGNTDREAAPDRRGVLGAFCDLSDRRLHWWAFTAFELDPKGARNLAAELVLWADRREQ